MELNFVFMDTSDNTVYHVTTMPLELIQLCLLMYFINIDSWNTEIGDLNGYIISNENKIVQSTTGSRWSLRDQFLVRYV